jgi:hypothetical protein
MKNEPVLTIASITALATAVVTLLVAFGLPLTQDQQQAVLGFVAVVAPLVAAYFARKRVTPVG